MPIVPGLDDVSTLTGGQSIAVDEPTVMGALPQAEQVGVPLAEPTANPEETSSSAPSLGGLSGGSSALRDKLVAAGMRYIGQPYSWGNLDCSGLVQRAYAAVGIQLPRISYQQANAGQRVGINSLQTGDLVAWDEGPRNPGADHIAIFVGFDKKGRPQILEAAHTGTDVRVRTLGANEGAWGVHMNVGG